MPRKNVQSTRKQGIRTMFGALVDLVGVMNRPQRDARMIKEAGIVLDRALFPLLVGISRAGPINVGELADRAGRDYTTVSRQIAKLESLGLIERRQGSSDKRVTEALITAEGQKMAAAIDAARDRLLGLMLADWSTEDIQTLAPLMRRLADSALVTDTPPVSRPRLAFAPFTSEHPAASTGRIAMAQRRGAKRSTCILHMY